MPSLKNTENIKYFYFIERVAIAVCTAAVTFGSYLLWENHKVSQRVITVQEQLQKNDQAQDLKISELMTRIEVIQTETITREELLMTLKRMELFLAAHSEQDRGRMVGKALKMEVETLNKK